jgi:hypothetical protein
LYSVSVLKSSVLPLVFAITVAVTCAAQAQVTGYANPSNGTSTDPFGSAPGMGGANGNTKAARQRPGASDTDNSENSDDETVYRLKTKDSLGAGSMSRDEGQLTAKQLRREKMSKVESTKQLPTTGVDPKFQGNLLQSSVTSITDISQKANAENKVINEGDPRFRSKALGFTPSTEEDAKKKEAPRTKAETSPSPSPTASANPSKR